MRLWGATAAVRTVVAVGLVPHTAAAAYVCFLPLDDFAESRYTAWCEGVIPWPAGAAGLLYLAGTVLLLTSRDAGRGGRPPSAGDTGPQGGGEDPGRAGAGRSALQAGVGQALDELPLGQDEHHEHR